MADDENKPADESVEQEPLIGPLGLLSLWVIGGIALGLIGGTANVWLIAAVATAMVGGVLSLRKRYRAAVWVWLFCLMLLASAWSAVRVRHAAPDDVRQYISDEAQLAELIGVIVEPPRLVTSSKGAMGRFNYEPPGTLFVLAIESPASGRVLVKVEEADHRLRVGDRVRVRGWLGAIDGPMNPGEYDWAARAVEQGVYGRLSVPTRGNCEVIGTAHHTKLARLREALSDGASASLRIGMDPRGEAMGLLDALLLGRRGGLPAELSDAFRRTGLAHLLSISGAHLGILLWVTWWVVTGLMPHPRRAAAVVLVVLGVYLLIVPPRVPVVRAGIMAALFLMGAWSGRRPRGMDLLLLAGVIALLWRPADLMTAGFQLSFGVVAALLLFVRRVGQLFWPDPPVEAFVETTGMWAARRGADYLAVNVVAFLAAAPLVMFHFKVLTPLAALLSVLALPLVTAVLAVGFAKILIGLALPTVGLVFSGLLTWLCDGLLRLIEHGAGWPLATIDFGRSPTPWWTVGAVAVTAALMGGWFAQRRRAMVLAMLIVVGWLAVDMRVGDRAEPTEMRIEMMAVGNGSCYLLRLPRGEGEARPYTIMFDCGSQEYHDVGATSITPTLGYLGVKRIDAVFLSHADFDHYCGLLDVIDGVPVGKVFVPRQMLDAAKEKPGSSAAFLVEGLAKHEVTIEPIGAGWTRGVGESRLAVVWPPEGLIAERSNDSSLVLRVTGPDGRRVLMSGDIGDMPMQMMMAAEVDVRAEVCDLPHHGAWVEVAGAWIDFVKPHVVLQSSGRRRLLHERWLPVLAERGIAHYSTGDRGMVSVRMTGERGIEVEAYRGGD